MGVISVRLNEREDKMLKQLADYFHADKSTLIKKSLLDLYETMRDMETVETYEDKEKRGKTSFVTAEDILAG